MMQAAVAIEPTTGIHLDGWVDRGWTGYLVPTEDIGLWWSFVEPGLTDVDRHAPCGWNHQAVRDFLEGGHTSLVALFLHGKAVGFFILARERSAVSGAHELMVWYAWTRTADGGDFGHALAEHLALVGGYDVVVFHSPRDGWLRRAEQMGFKLRTRTYSKRVGPAVKAVN